MGEESHLLKILPREVRLIVSDLNYLTAQPNQLFGVPN